MSIFKRIKRMRLDKEHLLDILKNDDDWELRKSAADKLRVFEETDVVDALLYALQNDSNEDVRVTSVNALATIKSIETVESLASVLDDTNKEVVKSVAFALLQIGEPKAIDHVLVALRRVSDKELIDWFVQWLEFSGVNPDDIRKSKKRAQKNRATEIMNNLSKIRKGMKEETLNRLFGSPKFTMTHPTREICDYETDYGNFQITFREGYVEDKQSVNSIIERLRKIVRSL